MPSLSFSAFTSGARQLVVQDALEMTVWLALSVLSLTPKTMVASTSLPPGAEMMTFFAPPFRCAPRFFLAGEKPGAFEHHVHAEVAPWQFCADCAAPAR